ncbi:hypothetical protein I7I50_06233 [Histoplasma capsulatum G186AR]|uniref:Uncharacterized protein n=1 Tax=Ajellomyces capsulatus TaxID=5037 RepID=A0A8H8D3A3_AJECA|nr:hypothetical protein I7I52_10694 [Histoplasma capsulatum]QSS67220.1 hypothetical protein I7I50_06233 [Histoplasma capsulatum G186AR]
MINHPNRQQTQAQGSRRLRRGRSPGSFAATGCLTPFSDRAHSLLLVLHPQYHAHASTQRQTIILVFLSGVGFFYSTFFPAQPCPLNEPLPSSCERCFYV